VISVWTGNGQGIGGKVSFEPPSRFTSFDHLVGTREQRRRHVEAECFGGFKIEDGFVFGRLHHRQIGDLLALENAPLGFRAMQKSAQCASVRVHLGISAKPACRGVVEEEPS
jgi:hypothetical protein